MANAVRSDGSVDEVTARLARLRVRDDGEYLCLAGVLEQLRSGAELPEATREIVLECAKAIRENEVFASWDDDNGYPPVETFRESAPEPVSGPSGAAGGAASGGEEDGAARSSDTDADERLSDEELEEALEDLGDHPGRQGLRAEIRAGDICPEVQRAWDEVRAERRAEDAELEAFWSLDSSFENEVEREGIARIAADDEGLLSERDYVLETPPATPATPATPGTPTLPVAEAEEEDFIDSILGIADHVAKKPRLAASGVGPRPGPRPETAEAVCLLAERVETARRMLGILLDRYELVVEDAPDEGASDEGAEEVFAAASELLADCEGRGRLEFYSTAKEAELWHAVHEMKSLVATWTTARVAKRKRDEMEAIDEIRFEQASTALVIETEAFRDLATETLDDVNDLYFLRGGNRCDFAEGALEALQVAAEDHLVRLFGAAGRAAVRAERDYITPADLRFATAEK